MGIIIESTKINEILSIYKPEYIYLKSAEVYGKKIIGFFRQSVYPYTNEDLFKYITGTTAVLYLAQLAYVLSAVMIEQNIFRVTTDISYKEFLSLRNRAQMYFTQLNMEFKKMLLNSEDIQVVMEITRAKRIRKTVIANASFDFQNCIVGHLQLTMALP